MEYDLVLVNPLLQFETGNNYVEYLGFSYIAAYLRKKGYLVKIIDIYLEGISLEECAERLKDINSKVIGFTSMSSIYIENINTIISMLDKGKRIYVVGGIYATQNYEQILKKVCDLDFVFLGEGEKTWATFLHNLDHGIRLETIKGIAYRHGDNVYCTGMSDFLTQEEMLNLPRPEHDTLEISLKRDGIAQIATSRGCYGNCSFCAISNYYKEAPECRWRYYNMETCIDELEYLVNHYHVKYVDFCDEEFIGPHTKKNFLRLDYFVEEIKRRKIKVQYMIYCRANDIEEALFTRLKESGLNRVFLGIEFGNNDLLYRYHKGTNVDINIRAIQVLEKLGINISVGYIMFEPFMNLKQLKDNFNFYFNYCPFKLDRLSTKMAIFPNTRLYEETKEMLGLDKVVWDFILGDYYDYKFKDLKVEIMFQIMLDLKEVLSKSQSYYKVKKGSKNQNEYAANFSKWKRELHNKIIRTIESLDEMRETNPDYVEFKEKLKKDITIWDNTYLL